MKKILFIFILLITLSAFARAVDHSDSKPKQTSEMPTHCSISEIVSPVAIKRVAPNYPDSLKAKKIEGTVWVQCFVGKDGTIGKIEVFKSVSPELDKEAIKALKQWTFEPAKSHGKPVAVWIKLPFVFKIENKNQNKK